MERRNVEAPSGVAGASVEAGPVVVDDGEVRRFVLWMRGIAQHEAYMVLLMIRSSGLKERYGFKGSDHKLDSRVVHGYLDQRLPSTPLGDGVEYWRLRLYESIHKLSLLGVHGVWHYTRFKPGSSTEVEEVIRVPPQLIGLYISINPSDVLKASLSTVRDVEEGIWGMARQGGRMSVREFYRRPDTRYHANIMRHMRTVFHVVDIDDEGLAGTVYGVVSEELGYKPAYITTRRGLHILVELPLLEELGTIGRWAGRTPKPLAVLLSEYKKTRSRQLAEKIVDEALHGGGPLFHRLSALGSVLQPGQAPLVEVKKKSIEPVPGVMYKGVVPRFTPERV